MTKLLRSIDQYISNSKKILNSYNNPLKRKENLQLKDELEIEFYDTEANIHLKEFDEELYKYDENEKFPLSHQYFYNQMKDVNGKNILDIGCGYGFTSVKLAKNGGVVTSIDISPKMIELAKKNAEFNDVGGSITFTLMSAQDMKFDDESFDYVVGFGVLHHLNLELSKKEIHRVLKPNGKAMFIEPRIPLKFLIFIRSLFPNKCLESPGGSQLTDKEINYFGSNFKKININYFLFLKKLTRFPFLKKYDSFLDDLDVKLVKKIPIMKKLYWAFVLEFEK